MTLILDSGALVAAERGDRAMWRRLKGALQAGQPPITHGGVVAQIWRGGSGRQAPLARALAGVDVAPLDDSLGRSAGVLLGKAGQRDAIDAALICLARDDDVVVTEDIGDMARLVEAFGRHIDIVKP
ncbi:MAG TPA: hypothetical protein VF180_01770 [Acidimicrobiia bacterium]